MSVASKSFLSRFWASGVATLVAVLLLATGVAAQELRHRGPDVTSPTPAELAAYTTAFNITSRIAYLLDGMSNADTPEEEDAVLAEIRPLLHPDVTVTSDGRSFTGREAVLEGMRVVHSRRQDNSKRLETSPTTLHSGLRGSPRTFTIATVQQHWWNDPETGELLMANRNTELTIERVGREWLVTQNTLQTVTGPITQ